MYAKPNRVGLSSHKTVHHRTNIVHIITHNRRRRRRHINTVDRAMHFGRSPHAIGSPVSAWQCLRVHYHNHVRVCLHALCGNAFDASVCGSAGTIVLVVVAAIVDPGEMHMHIDRTTAINTPRSCRVVVVVVVA